MNIESVKLSSLVPSSAAVESLLPPLLADGGVIAEGFSGALVAQIGLLSAIKTEDVLPQTTNVSGLQDVNGTQSVAGLPVGKVDTQDFATLLGNDLPASYKTKDDVDREAVLVAVTDTFKYIAMGATAGEKAARAEQNMSDVVAMPVPAEQSMKDTVAMAIPVEQNMKEVTAVTISAEQSTADVVSETLQSMKDVGVPVQMNLEQLNGKSDKKQIEGKAQIEDVADNREAEVLAAAIMLPVVMVTEQAKAASEMVPADAIKEDMVSLFIKPSTVDAKPNTSLKAPDDLQRSEAVFRQPVQDKQDFNLKYFENAGLAERAGRAERQIISLEGEKALPRIGTDITALNRSIVDNKADVPAITKPLSHQEWNKDLGERIVWMSSKAIPAAEIRLNPQHLGPISVRVNVADDQATVIFTAQHSATREALEASIPKLREMMGAQQLNLVEVSVSQGSASDQGRSQSQNFAQTADGRWQQVAVGAVVDGVDDVEQEIESGRAVVSKGLLSIYA